MQLSANKHPADLAGSGWYEILPPPSPPRILEDSVTADWVIIGAGFAGMTAARRIVEKAPGERVSSSWGLAASTSRTIIRTQRHDCDIVIQSMPISEALQLQTGNAICPL